MQERLIVLKFGSSVLRSLHDLPNVVHEIYRWYRDGYRVIAVVSAFANTTETLIRQSQLLCATPEPFATAELLATGERTSAALLGIALDRVGVSARVVSPREIGFEVVGTPLDAEPTAVDVTRVGEYLDTVSVLVVPGFFGTDAAGRTHLLGRGGSDFTAMFLAVQLRARCRLVKDVDGVYESDPASGKLSHPRRFETLTYIDALRVAGKLIQPKAATYVQQHETTCEVAALHSENSTLICDAPTRISPATAGNISPQGVVLLGCGTVGYGVYQRLLANPDRFRVLGVWVRDQPKHQAEGIPPGLLHTSFETLRTLRPALAIDALPGVEPSRAALAHYLAQRVHVVSANKAVIAEHGRELSRLARETGVELVSSAAVGGATPMFECCSRHAGETVTLSVVLNGTCNFMLDACAGGATFGEAIAEAQRLGFAEIDPSEDLLGRDAARKLTILARQVFGVELEEFEVQALDDSVTEAARSAASAGQRVRQVALATRTSAGITASVTFQRVDLTSPFYALSGEWNALALTTATGDVVTVRGRGAGRWPTSEAVMADVLDIARRRFERNPVQNVPENPRVGGSIARGVSVLDVKR